MDRLQKKCFIAAIACHGLLVCVLLFGSALMPSPDELPSTTLKFYSPKEVSDALSRGGDPEALPPQPPAPVVREVQPPAAQPEPPKAQVEPPKAQIEPPKTRVETPKARPEPPKPVDQPKIRAEIPKVVVKPKQPEPKDDPEPPKTPRRLDPDSLKPVVRKSTDAAKAAQEAAAARDRAEQNRKTQQFAKLSQNIGKQLSSKTVVESTPGIGTPGEMSVNYRDLIASKYYNAWSAPAGLDDATPIVRASITIARTGEVISARITDFSGNALMDKSIAAALEAVKFIEPFPEGSTDQQRTVTIKFNLKAKRQTG